MDTLITKTQVAIHHLFLKIFYGRRDRYMTAKDTVQITVTWPQIIGGTTTGVLVLISLMWWIAGIRAETLDVAHHESVPSETRAYINEHYVTKTEFNSVLKDIRESQLRIEGALFTIQVPEHNKKK